MNAHVHSGGDAPVPFDDRGLAYGDGLFETVLVRDGAPLLWEAHLARLQAGLERLGIPTPGREIFDALPAHGVGCGLMILKLLMTRGSGGRGYQLPENMQPRLRWRMTPFTPQADRWQTGVTVRSCHWRLPRQRALAGLKHLNRLDNVMARQEWTDPAIAEGLLCDTEGLLIEATAMNLAWFDREQRCWMTPRLHHCGVAGTLRQALLEAGVLTEIEASPEALANAEAGCVFNSVQGVWPIEQWVSEQQSDTPPLRRTWHLEEQPVREAVKRLQVPAHALLGYPVQ
ncbi:aminodeoxychorismate lyase [Kushneria phosphatilytica]|uniref:Aminodeoxychorismate lyase n=1 Tax=Kushneria phosphatilytica TaxID=657387 RepID=A0A1S1NWJ9_9GAMM|nr:aminodeoxychorismate lyase [Kushneria phosphatilytica]OHV11807.1 aminodeoxychorismate lyase [Kushneria phosphatilytica]QEL10972.1 aminodeoxychorismate lyase [Kushneria phosphatilytica]